MAKQLKKITVPDAPAPAAVPTSGARTFVRDVAVQAIGGVCAAIIIYVGAILLGYLAVPGVRETVFATAAFFIPVTAWTILGVRFAMNKRTHPVLVVVLGLLVLAGFVALGIGLAQNPLPDDFFPFPGVS